LPILFSLGCAGRTPYATVDELELDNVVFFSNVNGN
jgi:hypothetical protein